MGLASRTVSAAALATATVAAVAACGSGSAGHTASPSSASPSATQPKSAASSGNLAANGSGLCGAIAQVDSLTVQRTSALPGNHPGSLSPRRRR